VAPLSFAFQMMMTETDVTKNVSPKVTLFAPSWP
jgi:hypothetical protein